MRGAKAKALRRMARRVTEGLPLRRLIVGQEGTKLRMFINKQTGKEEARPVKWIVAVNDPKTTRAVYRRWKKISIKGRTVFKDA